MSRPSDPTATSPFELWIDFDGTLVTTNVAMVLVKEFCANGKEVAATIDEKLARGEMTLREAWAAEVALLPADRLEEMALFAARHTRFRTGAIEFCEWLTRTGTPTTILSGGLDFYIAPVLENAGLSFPVLSEVVRRAPEGHLILEHPHAHASCTVCGICKAQAVAHASREGALSVFIGDGGTDRYAAEVADIVFARHRLRAFCEAEGVPYLPFEEFGPVTRQFERWTDGTEPLPVRRRRGRSGTSCPVSRDLFGQLGSALPVVGSATSAPMRS